VVAGMMRVKNEARWIERCLKSLFPVCDQIFLMDDHSTDGTADICSSKVTVLHSPFEGLDEARDKQWLLSKVMECYEPAWIIATDGDEMLAPWSVEPLKAALNGPYPCLSFKVLYLWDREDQVRVDGVYGDFHRESAFKPNGSTFGPSGNGANFHCGNVPWGARQKRQVRSDIQLLHFGYLHKEDRIRKHKFYNEADPGNSREDFYNHIAIGDLFPSDSKFMHGGPLELRQLN
jgi:glycosyltransferase involved in cell wall biosynthesis